MLELLLVGSSGKGERGEGEPPFSRTMIDSFDNAECTGTGDEILTGTAVPFGGLRSDVGTDCTIVNSGLASPDVMGSATAIVSQTVGVTPDPDAMAVDTGVIPGQTGRWGIGETVEEGLPGKTDCG